MKLTHRSKNARHDEWLLNFNFGIYQHDHKRGMQVVT